MPPRAMVPSGAPRKVANGLVAMSSAAILAVYAAGYAKTRAAADLLDAASNERKPAMPAPATAGELTPPVPIEPTTTPVPSNAQSPALAVPITPEAVTTPTPAPLSTPSPTPVSVAASTPVQAEVPVSTPAPPVVDAPPAPEFPTPTPTPSVPTKTAEAPEAPAPSPARPMPKETYMDGTYLGWGTSRHGDIQASVTIEEGRITAATIAKCLTRYSCSWVAHLPPQVVARQSPDVDYVSGATQSANAFYWAVVDALSKAK